MTIESELETSLRTVLASHLVGHAAQLSAVLAAVSAIFPDIKDDMKRVSDRVGGRKKIRGYIDGCYDIMHSGHFNAIRQARALVDELVVGVHSDEEITRNKGPPVMNDAERLAVVKACKWVDVVEFGTPYAPTIELLDRLNCDYCIHGDDISAGTDGKDAYWMIKEAGRMRTIKRTEGVSTTHLVGRILTTPESLVDEIKRGFAQQSDDGKSSVAPTTPNGAQMDSDAPLPSPAATPLTIVSSTIVATGGSAAAAASGGPASPNLTRQPSRSPASRSPFLPTSSFFPTSYRISQFGNHRTPKPSDHVVYVDGDFDLFHAGHVQYLEKARALGSFLYVGIHDDPSTYNVLGGNFPIMALHERVLNVLACRWVDEVIIGAPWVITKDLLTTFNIQTVAVPRTDRRQAALRKLWTRKNAGIEATGEEKAFLDEPYIACKRAGVYVQPIPTILSSGLGSGPEGAVLRVLTNRAQYEKRNETRAKKEEAFIATRTFVAEI